jgi:ferredoxin-nitrite reductase
MEEKLDRRLDRVEAHHLEPRPPIDRLAHIGIHAQRQPGLNWVGVWTPLGRMTTDQMRVLADVAGEYGDGDIRLTVWQNLLISGIPDHRVEAAVRRINESGLAIEVTNVRAGLVACTGNQGCKFAASDTKTHALQIADHLDARLKVDQPVNIHLTGCHHSCAQHHIGDIGLLAAKVAVNEEGDQVEGYHILVGGGFGAAGRMGEQIYADIKAQDAPAHVEGLLRAYLEHRASPDESFQVFSARTGVEALKKLAGVGL